MGWLPLLATVALLTAVAVAYLAWYARWEVQHTTGLSYFGRSAADRALLKRRLWRYSRPVVPLVRVMALWKPRHPVMPSFEYAGVCGPPTISSPELFVRAARYQPRAEDVFVATQMRSGTTWMLQLVHQVVTRGSGELGDHGHRHLNAVCPWIETTVGVPLDEAPLVGAPPTRIIKTHLPSELCPWSEQARYIYVARDPVGCFASIAAYMRELLGPLAPSREELAEWYCSDRMYWLPWPRHLLGWWTLSGSHANVLLVRYEDMVGDFGGVLDRVAAFLGQELTVEERSAVTARCSFAYMKAHEEQFEMAPPTMFSVRGHGFFTGAGAKAYARIPPQTQSRILEYCQRELAARGCHAGRLYPDLQWGSIQ